MNTDGTLNGIGPVVDTCYVDTPGLVSEHNEVGVVGWHKHEKGTCEETTTKKFAGKNVREIK